LAKQWQKALSRSNEELGGISDETRTNVKKKLHLIQQEWESDEDFVLPFKWNKITPTHVSSSPQTAVSEEPPAEEEV